MQPSFAALEYDDVALAALRFLGNQGCGTKVLTPEECLPAKAVGLFGTSTELRNKFLRMSKHRFAQEGIDPPATWSTHPFLVAIHDSARIEFPRYRYALRQLADMYRSWGPWMLSPDAPWDPRWKDGEPHPDFSSWRDCALASLSSVTASEKLQHRLQPIFPVGDSQEVSELVVTGCALFNKPHTDVIAKIPAGKCALVQETLAAVIAESEVRNVRFVVPRGDLMSPILREHFHLFMFMSLEEAGKHAGQKFAVYNRILGEAHVHARSDSEIVEALEASALAVKRDLIGPLSVSSGVPVQGVSWTDYVGTYFDEAYAIALRHASVAESIYLERVRTRPSYASLHKIDPAAGLRRTIANNVFYIAEALYLRDNPGTAIVNCEFADTFWKGLEGVLEAEVWGSWRPFIGMVPKAARQPWGY
jgi:hypothetical protein